MISSRLRSLVDRSARQALLGGLALLLWAVAPGVALAQDATLDSGAGGLRTNDTDADPANSGGGAGLDVDDSSLRGTAATTLDPFQAPSGGNGGAAAAPDTSSSRAPKLRSTIKAPETSTAKARIGPPKLPDLEAYPTSAKPRGATIDTIAQPPAVVGPTVAAIPVLLPHRAKPDPTPFAPIGFTLGTLRLTPFVEQSIGFDSNPDQIQTGVKPSAFSRTEGGFDLLSLWSSNELRANMHGAYDDFFKNPNANRPDGAGTVDYTYEAARDLSFDTEGRFALSTQRPGSPELNVDVQGRPLISSYGASVGGTQTLGRFTVALHGTFDRTDYENGRLPDGTTVILDDENFNDYGLTGRIGYKFNPAFTPFVEVTGDSRVHDQRVDQFGYARDSDGITAKLGTTFEFSRLLTGDVSAGYEDRSYDDPRLRNLRGPLIDASLAYAISPLTTATLHATTSFDETTVAGATGAESRNFSLQLSHALLRNLTLTGIVGYLNTDYIGANIVENTISGTLKATYNINRDLSVDVSYNHQTLTSTQQGSSFDQDVFMVGLRVQH